MSIIDLSKIEERAKAVAGGYIWSAPPEAVRHALRDIAAGRIPPPATIPMEWMQEAKAAGVDPAMMSGISEGSGPA